MKKFLIIFVGLMMALPAFATGGEEQQGQNSETPTYPTDVVVSASYVKGAYDAVMGDLGSKTSLNTTATNTIVAAVNEVNTAVSGKQATLTSTGNNPNVVVTAAGPVVTGVSAADGTVTVTTGEITIPVGAASGNSVSGHATVWLQ